MSQLDFLSAVYCNRRLYSDEWYRCIMLQYKSGQILQVIEFYHQII